MTDTAQKSDFVDVKRALQGFQAARLNTTYADLKSDPQYEKIGVFFFEKLYAPEDFSFRDASIKKLQRVLKGKVYKGMVLAVSQVIELHELSPIGWMTAWLTTCLRPGSVRRLRWTHTR